jgi:putative hydrolase of the HAD superfamily
MGDKTRDHLVGKHRWLQRFHHLTWSCELRMAKPDAAIYLHTLDKLGVAPQESLFIDDIQRNIDAARALGIDGILFQHVAQLRDELSARKLENVIPFPALD